MKKDIMQPHDVEAEQATLGSILIDPAAIDRISTFLKPTDFFVERHGWIYEAMLDLRSKRQAIDLITLSDALRQRGLLEEVGGEAILTRLMTVTPSSLHGEYYAQILGRVAFVRNLMSAAGQIARLAHQNDQDAAEMADRAEQIIFEVTAKGVATGRGLAFLDDGLSHYYERLEYLSQNPNQVAGLPTGLADLDRILGGLQKGSMVVIAGRPGMGKSALALNIAHQAARKLGTHVAYFSLEMGESELVERLLAAETGIDGQRLKRGLVGKEEWSLLHRGIEALSKTRFLIDDTSGLSVMELKARARRAHVEHGLDLIVVDYLQLMSGDPKSQNREQEISTISRSLKALAGELGVPILALSQLSREVERRAGNRPRLSDLRESGSIEQDADVVIFIYRDVEYNPDTEFPELAELIVAKHRQGPTGNFTTYFRAAQSQFVTVSFDSKMPENEPTGLQPLEANGKLVPMVWQNKH